MDYAAGMGQRAEKIVHGILENPQVFVLSVRELRAQEIARLFPSLAFLGEYAVAEHGEADCSSGAKGPV
jgi:hypothetical protein